MTDEEAGAIKGFLDELDSAVQRASDEACRAVDARHEIQTDARLEDLASVLENYAKQAREWRPSS